MGEIARIEQTTIYLHSTDPSETQAKDVEHDIAQI